MVEITNPDESEIVEEKEDVVDENSVEEKKKVISREPFNVRLLREQFCNDNPYNYHVRRAFGW